MLFVVGGRGGNAAAEAIHRECRAKSVPCCVVAVPKSIDNDLLLIDKTFGFETAVEEAQKAILAAKVEASSACEASWGGDDREKGGAGRGAPWSVLLRVFHGCPGASGHTGPSNPAARVPCESVHP